jgi:RimJ/RimL family protein N-acetyltransferase
LERLLPVLVTPRFELRPPAIEDAPALLAFYGRCDAVPEATRFLLRPLPRDLDEVRARVGPEVRMFSAQRSWFQWLIRERGADASVDPRVLGYAAFVRWDHDNRRSEVAYAVDPARWGAGVAVEAVRAIVAFARAELSLHRVEAHVDPKNVASARVAHKLGLTLEGTLRDHVRTRAGYADTAVYASVPAAEEGVGADRAD